MNAGQPEYKSLLMNVLEKITVPPEDIENIGSNRWKISIAELPVIVNINNGTVFIEIEVINMEEVPENKKEVLINMVNRSDYLHFENGKIVVRSQCEFKPTNIVDIAVNINVSIYNALEVKEVLITNS